MDFSYLWQSMQEALGDNLLGVLGALAILVLGWLVAIVVRAGVRRSLGYVGLNRRVHSATDNKIDLESGVAAGAYYIVLLLALVGFFNALRLELISEPLGSLLDQVFAFARMPV